MFSWHLKVHYFHLSICYCQASGKKHSFPLLNIEGLPRTRAVWLHILYIVLLQSIPPGIWWVLTEPRKEAQWTWREFDWAVGAHENSTSGSLHQKGQRTLNHLMTNLHQTLINSWDICPRLIKTYCYLLIIEYYMRHETRWGLGLK